jgi:serine/threonine-protein kinase
LQAQGFKVQKQTEPSADPVNTVEQQNPPGGTSQPVGTTITLTVSDGSQATFNMPDLTGKTVSQAQNALQLLGWSGSFNTIYTQTMDPLNDGQIAQQQQDVGTAVAKNATIGITVYKFGSGPTTTGH